MSTIEITAENLEATIAGNDVVWLDFWAAWCGPCRFFAPVFEQASEEHPEMVFGKIDTEVQQELAAAFGITSIPTLMAFKEGIGIFSQPGALNAQQFNELIGQVEALDMDEVRAQIAAQEAQEKEAPTP